MRRSILAAVVVLLAAAACGGNSDDSGADDTGGQSDTTQASTSQSAADDDAAGSSQATSSAQGNEETPSTSGTEESADSDSGSEASGPSTATVTLGDETFSFSTDGAVVAQCLADLFGLFSIQIPMVDDNGAQADGFVSIVALHEGTDPETVGEVNSIEVAVGDEDWVADEDDMMFEQSDSLNPGMSQVDTLEIEGRTVRGTAVFYRQNSLFSGEVETLAGTFEATCGEERTS